MAYSQIKLLPFQSPNNLDELEELIVYRGATITMNNAI